MKIILLSLFMIFLSSCGITSAFDDNSSYQKRFEDGLSFFENEKYVQSSQQFNIIVQRASHTDLGDDALFFLAESFFLNEDYALALIEYENLVSKMGFSPYIEKSRWRICESLTYLSPNFFHDQESSFKAISQIQDFIDDYPDSEYAKDADKLLNSLRTRLAEKNIETGKLYIKLKAYDSAIISFNNVINNYYDTKFYSEANLEVLRCLMFLDRKNEAIELLEKIKKDEPSNSSSSFVSDALAIVNSNS
tara:strand:- start:921 stop:1667 length:747 start_codon:yes stop_codon:yes gene_type:complete